MKKFKPIFIAVLTLVVLFTVFIVSCKKEDDDSQLLLEEQIRLKFTLADAKAYFQSEATDLQLPLQTIIASKSGAIDLNDVTTIDWERAECNDFNSYLSYEIPLCNSRYGHAVMYEKGGADTLVSERADVHYSLLIQRGKAKDTTRMLVSAVISMTKERQRVTNGESYKFHGYRHGFTGYVIVSDLSGGIISIYSYSKGKRERYESYTLRSKEEADASQTRGFSVFGVAGGGSGNYGYSEYGRCAMCGKEEVLYFPDWWCLRCMEFTHIWYKNEYPHIPLGENMNSEIISLLSELLIAEDFPNGIYGYASGIYGGDRAFLLEFDKNPNEEGVDRMAEIVKSRNYAVYKNFVMDKSIIMEQIENFKRLINK